MPPAHDHDRADKPLATFRRQEQVNPAVEFGFNAGPADLEKSKR